MTALLWAGGAVVLLLLVWAVVLNASRVRRLHRLHVRTDAARAGLGSALERRAVAAFAVATRLAGTARGDDLRAALEGTAGARAAGSLDGEREIAENRVGRALAAVDRTMLPEALAEELTDAEQLVILARRVHNDAVRDTLDLRSRRLVRWLRLAGTAPAPAYFEIADPLPWSPPASRPSPAGTGSGASG